MTSADRRSPEPGASRKGARAVDERALLPAALPLLLVGVLPPGCAREVGTGEPERCNGLDDNGDGEVERGVDCPQASYFCVDAARCRCAETHVRCGSSQCVRPSENLTTCGRWCVSLLTSPIDCGACDRRCLEGETCEGGVCRCAGIRCNGRCAINDERNCGACGRSCAAGEHCISGVCRCLGQLCAGVCTDVTQSFEHCGMCGRSCGVGAWCNLGNCQCDVGFGFCGGGCVSTFFDRNNCGGCGIRCLPGQGCNRGQCL